MKLLPITSLTVSEPCPYLFCRLSSTVVQKYAHGVLKISTLSSIYYKPPEAFVLKQAPISRGGANLDDEDLDVSKTINTGAHVLS